jgi:hypothetical protein
MTRQERLISTTYAVMAVLVAAFLAATVASWSLGL